MSKPSKRRNEGRAFRARPSSCLPLLVAGALLAPAAAAQAAPPTPALTGTNPPSPNTSLRPKIEGDADGIVTSGVGGGLFATRGMGTRVLESEFTITIYAEDETCTDPEAVAAVGTAAELEGSGIQLSEDLAPDSETHFYANQTDPEALGEPSGCSNGIVYQQVSTPPPPPVFESVSPASGSNDNAPHLIGQAETGSVVSIYRGANCEESSFVVSASAAAFAAPGIQVAVPDNSTTTFYAKATLGGLSSECSSSSLTYQEVTPPEEPGGGEEGGGGGGGEGGGGTPPGEPPLPELPGTPSPPKLRFAPEGPANDNTPTVTGTVPGGAKVELYDAAGCRGAALAGASAAQLAGGLQVHVPDNSRTALYGVSIDAGGHSQCSSEAVVYIEDSTPPHTRFTSGPGARTHRTRALFRFVDVTGDSGVTFSCRLDHRHWKRCTSPLKLRRLSHGKHLLRVRAVDGAGNVEPKAAKRSFRVVG